MPQSVANAGQALLNAELYNGMASKDAELLATKLASIHAGGSSTSDKKLEAERNRLRKELQDAHLINSGLAQELRNQRSQNESLSKALNEKNALIYEWMHSTEAFKRLAKNYGTKLGISEDDQKTERGESILDVAEENPDFAKTELTQKAKAVLK